MSSILLLTMLDLPKFKNPKLLEQAFIHRSYLNELKTSGRSISSNERLEFLGDSILAFLTSEFLYKNFPRLSEGKLTSLRSFLVRTDSLAQAAKQLNLGRYLKLSHGEKQALGEENPSLLANTFEALVGAIFLDSGIEKTGEFLQATLFVKVDKKMTFDSLKDAKSLFQEIVQRDKQPTPVYRLLKAVGPDHKKIFTVGVYVSNKLWGEGAGDSKQEAEQGAAKAALENYPQR